MGQHYVAQFRLRHFAPGGKLAVYDKHEDKVFHATPEKVAHEAGFYHYPDGEGRTRDADVALKRLESDAAPVVASIARTGRFARADTTDWASLSAYLAAEMLRTPWASRMLSDAAEALMAGTRGLAAESGADVLSRTSPIESKATALSMLEGAGRLRVVELLKECRPVLVRAPQGRPFILGDHPVAMTRGTSGIDQYLVPLSSRLTLVLVRPEGMQESSDAREACIHPCTAGEASMAYASELNRLQVRFAERWLFAPISPTDVFKQVRSWIQEDPGLRHGLRPTIR